MRSGAPVALGLLIGATADAVLADPQRGHPVAAFGRWAGTFERRLWADDTMRGGQFVVAVTAPIVACALLIERAVDRRPGWHAVAIALGAWTVLGGTSLTRTGEAMATALEAGDTAAARELLPSLCGRDPSSLDGVGLARAGLESVAENTSDAVVAPLLWGALAGLPGLVVYRAVNTLDAMVGHRSERYRRFGTAAARLDDLANLAPARLTAVLTLAAAPVVHGSPSGGWRAWRRDASKHPSPNAGRCEATAAGVLGVQLGGVTVYGGRVENRPLLGTGRAPTTDDLRRGVRLSRAVQALAVLSCACLSWVIR